MVFKVGIGFFQAADGSVPAADVLGELRVRCFQVVIVTGELLVLAIKFGLGFFHPADGSVLVAYDLGEIRVSCFHVAIVTIEFLIGAGE